uniref:Uncharacterized protein n=1 Tax=Rhizophora mucronata TaxID=61149 RepID=A0A2P2NTM8_RHIMU
MMLVFYSNMKAFHPYMYCLKKHSSQGLLMEESNPGKQVACLF